MAEVEIDIEDIVTEWGEYYVNQSQNMSRLKKKLYQGTETDQYFKLQIVTDTVDNNAYAEMAEVLQAYQDAFTPKGDMTFKPVSIKLFPMKIDWEKNPTALWKSWLGFLAGDGIDRAEWPFIRYIIEQHLIARRDEDKEVKAIFKGEFSAPVAGTAGAAEDAMDGIRTIVRGWNTDGRSNAIATGAFESDPVDFVTQLEEFVAQIPLNVRRNLKNIFIDADMMSRYRSGKRSKYNQNWAQASDLETIEDQQNIRVTGLPSMEGSEMIFTSLPDLMVRRQNRAKNINTFKVESAKRAVSIYTDWFEGIGFLVPELLYHNDRDLA